ncbi:MAG: hypothetical protein JWL83_3642, partial [Actinomycetia bacterium]|nr:hypothetical protein [Actinomycetes bacterium]
MQRRLMIALSAIVVMIGATTGIAAANNTGTSNTGTVDAATQQRMTRLLQRGRAALSSHAAAAQPGYVPLSKGGTTDRVGDAGDPRADITNVNAYYSPDALDLSLRVVQPTNPATDPAWTSNNGIVGPEWGIDTNGDSNPEYVAIFGAGASGHLFADIVPFSSGGVGLQTCKGAKARFEHGSYIVTATPSCVGNAPHIWVGTFMVYFPDFTNPNVGGLDQAPDGRFFGPLAGPPGGYMLGAGDGGVFTYGSVPFHGSLGQLSIRNAVVDIATTSTVSGYVMLGADGGVFTFGRTTFSGSAVGFRSGRYVGIALTPSGKGYWLATSDGNILGFGDAHFYGST